MLPAFAIFFPIDVAVAATAVVHLANNLFKVALLGRAAAWRIVALFGVPAALTALAGAWLLERMHHRRGARDRPGADETPRRRSGSGPGRASGRSCSPPPPRRS